MTKPTMGSLFSGIGGFEVAAGWHDVKVLWQSEIEPWAVELLKKRFPDAIQLGDIQNVSGALIPPVDFITFGSPCQDMSVAGKRKGMKYICPECGAEFDIQKDTETCPECGADIEKTRSGLFMEAIRIIREMREATNGEYPKYIIWENVPGAFTSNKGMDFRAVLEEITESKIPMPESGRWSASGMVRGGKCDVAWRTLDAQYWGVSQRRKRIYLVGDYRTKCAAQILFKPESVSRHPKPSEKTRKGITSDIKNSIGTTSDGIIVLQDKIIGRKDKNTCRGDGISKDVSYTLTSFDVHGVCVPVIIVNDQGGSFISVEQNDLSPTLRAQTHGNEPIVCMPIMLEHHPGDSRLKIDESGNCQTLTSRMGTGGGNEPLIMMLVYAIDRAAYNQGINAQYDFSITCDNKTQTLVAKGPNAVAVPVVFQGQAAQGAELSISDKISPTLQCTKIADVLIGYIVRRLTPSECAKLQGFPADWHEGVKNSKGKDMPDTAAYKGYGNAVATVCAEYPIANIVEILREV